MLFITGTQDRPVLIFKKLYVYILYFEGERLMDKTKYIEQWREFINCEFFEKYPMLKLESEVIQQTYYDKIFSEFTIQEHTTVLSEEDMIKLRCDVIKSLLIDAYALGQIRSSYEYIQCVENNIQDITNYLYKNYKDILNGNFERAKVIDDDIPVIEAVTRELQPGETEFIDNVLDGNIKEADKIIKNVVMGFLNNISSTNKTSTAKEEDPKKKSKKIAVCGDLENVVDKVCWDAQNILNGDLENMRNELLVKYTNSNTPNTKALLDELESYEHTFYEYWSTVIVEDVYNEITTTAMTHRDNTPADCINCKKYNIKNQLERVITHNMLAWKRYSFYPVVTNIIELYKLFTMSITETTYPL